MSQTWSEHEKALHVQYNIPNDRTIVAVLGNGTVITLPPINIPNEHVQSSNEHVQPHGTLLPPED
jgi:hypothetical protein